jgi:hypothetical protein
MHEHKMRPFKRVTRIISRGLSCFDLRVRFIDSLGYQYWYVNLI